MRDEARAELLRAARAARRRLFAAKACDAFLRTAPWGMATAAAAAAADLRWSDGAWAATCAALGVTLPLALSAVCGLLHLAGVFQAAVALDHRGGLKDRIASALEFSQRRPSNPAHRAQIADAVAHARSLRIASVIQLTSPRKALGAAAGCAVLALSLFTPPVVVSPGSLGATAASLREQLEELQRLREALEEQAPESDETMQAVLERLKALEERVSSGLAAERDAMIELARLEEELQAGAARMGAEALEQELETVTPHWMAADATRAVASAARAGEMREAAERVRALAERMREGDLSPEAALQAAGQMRIAAGKLGDRAALANSFAGDLAQAADAMERADADAMQQAADAMGAKLDRIGGARQYRALSRQVAAGRAAMGQAAARRTVASGDPEGDRGGRGRDGRDGRSGADGEGRGDSPGERGRGGGRGGLEAGTDSAGDPVADASRLEKSLRRIIEVSGAMGEGPVESQVESTEGSLTESQVALRDVVAEYAAVAEQAIAREEIPLSHRFHVKRYFQTIRPAE